MEPLALVPVALGLFWLWALIDVVYTSDEVFKTGDTVLWMITLVGTGPLGALAYLFAGRPRDDGLATPSSTGAGSDGGHGALTGLRGAFAPRHGLGGRQDRRDR